MIRLEEKSHSLELQLGQEKETRMRLESTIEELQKENLTGRGRQKGRWTIS